MSRLIFTITALAMLAGTTKAAEEKTLALRDTDNGKAFTLTDENLVVILLPGNPTTGYSWKVASVEGRALAVEGEVNYLKEDPALRKTGSGGVFAANFRPKDAGKALIIMEYRRPWEKNQPAAKTFSVTVEVKAAPATRPTTRPATTRPSK